MLTLLPIIIYMAFISLGLPDSLLGSAWPAISAELAVPVSYAGILSVIVTGGTIISSFFSEKVIRRFGTGLVTAVSVMLTAFALIGFSLSSSLIWLCVLAVPLGLGAGSVDAGLNNFVALHFKSSHMSWLHCFWGIGATAGPVIMSFFLAGKGGWKMGYRTIGIIQIVLIVILFLSLPLWKKAGSTPENNEHASRPGKLKEILGISGAKTVLMTFFCYCAVEAAAGLWGSSYLVINRGIPSKVAAKWISLYYFGITLGRFIAGFVTMKLNNKTMIRIGEAVVTIGLITIFLPFGSISLQLGFLLLGLGCAPIFPCMLHETPVRFGKQLSQSLMGIQMACAYIGSTFMPPLFGLLAQYVSISIYPLFLLAITAIMILANESTNRVMHKETLID